MRWPVAAPHGSRLPAPGPPAPPPPSKVLVPPPRSPCRAAEPALAAGTPGRGAVAVPATRGVLCCCSRPGSWGCRWDLQAPGLARTGPASSSEL